MRAELWRSWRSWMVIPLCPWDSTPRTFSRGSRTFSGQSPWVLGATGEGRRASGEGPRVVSGVVSGVVSRGSEVRSSLFGSAGAVRSTRAMEVPNSFFFSIFPLHPTSSTFVFNNISVIRPHKRQRQMLTTLLMHLRGD